MFEAWDAPDFFAKARIDVDGRLIWDDCDDDECDAHDGYDYVELSIYLPYMRITGKSWEELPLDDMPRYSMFPQLLDVSPLPGYRLRLEYNDGVSGEVDLSVSAGNGKFKAWEESGFFEKAHLDGYGNAAWDDEVQIYPDDLYMKLTGKSCAELVKWDTSDEGPKPVAVEPREGFRIWLRFNDGLEGELDVSDLQGKEMFKALDDRAFFEGVHINEFSRTVSWGCTDSCGFPDSCITSLDITPEICYVQLLGFTLDEIRAMPPVGCWGLIAHAKSLLGK